MTPEEKLQWYKKEKRKSVVVDGRRKNRKHESFAVTTRRTQEEKTTTGLNTYNKMFSYDVFCAKQRMLDKSKETIEAEWRSHLMNPNIKRGTFMVDDKKVGYR